MKSESVVTEMRAGLEEGFAREQSMRRQLQICSEADYLRAHLTMLDRQPQEKRPGLRNWKGRMRVVLKKWVMAAGAHVMHRSVC